MVDENDNLDRGDVVAGDETQPPVPASTPPTDEGTLEGDKLDLDKEGDETPEEKAERERLEAEEAKKRNIRIPKSRFDEAQAKARAREQALLEEIEKLKGGQQASATQQAVSEMRAKIETLQDTYEDMILDGRKDDARKVRKQLEAMREELVDYQTSVKSDAARRAAIDELSYNAQLASLESQYPALNPENETFDPEKTDEVASVMRAFVHAGDPRPKALAKAVKYVMGAPPEQQTSDAARTLAAERARKAREKAAAANAQQPPTLSKVGLDSDKAGGGGEQGIDIMRMSQDRFAKLDEETKARLRGDVI